MQSFPCKNCYEMLLKKATKPQAARKAAQRPALEDQAALQWAYAVVPLTNNMVTMSMHSQQTFSGCTQKNNS